LVGVTQDHVIDGGAVNAGARDQFADYLGDQIIRTHRGQTATVATEGSPQACIDISVEHGSKPIKREEFRRLPALRGAATDRGERGGAARGWGGNADRRSYPPCAQGWSAGGAGRGRRLLTILERMVDMTGAQGWSAGGAGRGRRPRPM